MKYKEMIYIGRDFADSFSCALTFGEKYNCAMIYNMNYNIKEEIYIQDSRIYKCLLIDDLGKSITLSPNNFCTVSEYRDIKLNKLGI
jgi:hypothetical protein